MSNKINSYEGYLRHCVEDFLTLIIKLLFFQKYVLDKLDKFLIARYNDGM